MPALSGLRYGSERRSGWGAYDWRQSALIISPWPASAIIIKEHLKYVCACPEAYHPWQRICLFWGSTLTLTDYTGWPLKRSMAPFHPNTDPCSPQHRDGPKVSWTFQNFLVFTDCTHTSMVLQKDVLPQRDTQIRDGGAGCTAADFWSLAEFFRSESVV